MSFFKNIGFLSQMTFRNLCAIPKKRRDCHSDTLEINSALWLGHATVLLNINGITILTDPVLCNYLGYMKRLVKVPINITDYHVDYILLSHGHTDHIHFPSLRKVNKDAVVIVPTVYKRLVKHLGFKNVYKISPGETFEDDNLKIESIEAIHDGRRFYIGNFTESNSYLIKCKDKTVFYAGDTAYTENFNNIKSDIALMPVGCYTPERFSVMHCSPEESFKMFKKMDSPVMLPIHYRTFIISLDNEKRTLEKLKELNDGSIKIADIGQRVNF